MLQTAGGIASVYRCYPKDDKICGIYLVPSAEANQIRGKVQICDAYEIQHWGIVVELECIITFSDRFKDVIKIFEPDADSPTVMRSTVYFQLAGRPEGLEKGDLRSQYLKKLREHSHIFEFKLDLPTTKPLPAALTTEYVDVTYHLIVYKRTRYGYEIMEQKPLKFYGYHGLLLQEASLSRPIQQHQLIKEFPGITLTFHTPKSSYLRYELIPFTVSVARSETQQPIGNISVFLIKTLTVFENSATDILETFISKKSSNRKEFCVRGVFKTKREFPTYDSPKIHGLKLKYTIKCDIFNQDSEIIASNELDVEIGTTRIVPIPVREESTTVTPVRSRSMSLASSMLSLFPPSYSNLLFRSGSITSLETLPPHYDDLNFHQDSHSDNQDAEEA